MSWNKMTMARLACGALVIGSSPGGQRGVNASGTIAPTTIYNFFSISAALTPGAIAANSSVDVSVTVTGAAVGDPVVVEPYANIAAGLVWTAYVSAANTVKVRIANVTTGSITPTGGATWTINWFGLAS
jgi:hypothetical protein